MGFGFWAEENAETDLCESNFDDEKE
jgi:hypothetical protein